MGWSPTIKKINQPQLEQEEGAETHKDDVTFYSTSLVVVTSEVAICNGVVICDGDAICETDVYNEVDICEIAVCNEVVICDGDAVRVSRIGHGRSEKLLSTGLLFMMGLMKLRSTEWLSTMGLEECGLRLSASQCPSECLPECTKCLPECPQN